MNGLRMVVGMLILVVAGLLVSCDTIPTEARAAWQRRVRSRATEASGT